VGNASTLLGFVGAPFTLASYIVEGGSSKNYTHIKRLAFATPEVSFSVIILNFTHFIRLLMPNPVLSFVYALQMQILHSLLQKLSHSIARYIKYQADNGAQVVQIFDSWATQLSPADFEVFSLPYLKQIIAEVKQTHPNLPIILYASGSGGLLERMALAGADVVSVDWSVDMAEARKRLGSGVPVQGNVDPGVLFGSKDFITKRIHETVAKAGQEKHILNLGHGVLLGTPEENVEHFFNVSKAIRYQW
jgi:uroporphyrinogen decarboxylase